MHHCACKTFRASLALCLLCCCLESLGLSAPVIKAIKRKGYRLPTPIQRRSLPVILQGMDVIGMARTGSGKTAAFVIPMIERCVCSTHMAQMRAA
jgi:ATP-dependent RNA helicase DDX54/DBP10